MSGSPPTPMQKYAACSHHPTPLPTPMCMALPQATFPILLHQCPHIPAPGQCHGKGRTFKDSIRRLRMSTQRERVKRGPWSGRQMRWPGTSQPGFADSIIPWTLLGWGRACWGRGAEGPNKARLKPLTSGDGGGDVDLGDSEHCERRE